MSDLTQFLGLVTSTGINSVHVYNTNIGNAVLDGGQCCAVAVPGTSTKVHIEMWGGGGGGNGACCCQWPYGQPNSGQYTKRTVAVAGGDTLTICAAGSTCCSPNCKGQDGYPSFVLQNGSTIACVLGGCGGCALCFYKGQWPCTGLCVAANLRNGAICGDIGICTYQGMSVTHNFCSSDQFEATAGSPKLSQNLRIGGAHCAYSFTRAGCCRNPNHWPGGAGNGGSSCGGGCCWGGWGAGGLVILTFHG